MVSFLSRRLFAALLLLVVTTLFVGCEQPEPEEKPKATCKGLVEKAKLCKSKFEVDDVKLTEAEVIQGCQTDLEAFKEEQTALLKCVENEECQKAESCIAEKTRALVIAKTTKAILTDVDAKKFDAIEEHPHFNVCVVALKGEDKTLAGLPETFKTACSRLLGGAAKARHDKFSAARDADETLKVESCYLQYRDLLAFTGKETQNAEVLCSEIGMLSGIRKGLKQAASYLEKKEANLPFECLYYPAKLAEIGTDWSKGRRDALLQACYVELGVVILESRSDKAIEDSCGEVQQKVFEVYAKEGLSGKSQTLDAQIARYKEKSKCK